MYLGVWGSVPHIERAALDGGQRLALVGGVGRVNGLAVDLTDRRLYWADVDEKRIESCDLDGKNRRIVVSDMPQPHGLTQCGPFFIFFYIHTTAFPPIKWLSLEFQATIASLVCG